MKSKKLNLRKIGIIFILLLSFIPSYIFAQEKFAVGLGYPFLSAKYYFSQRIASEALYASGEGIKIFAGRGYWNFYKLNKLNAFTGLEFGYIDFDTLDTIGYGYETGLFIGGEYTIFKKFSLALDIFPMFISLNSEGFNVDGIEWVTNITIYYHLFTGREKEVSLNKKLTFAKSETKEKLRAMNVKEEKDINKTSELVLNKVQNAIPIEEEIDLGEDEVNQQEESKKVLLVADFNSMRRKNNLGCDFGVWDLNPNDYTQSCEASFSNEEIGCSLKLNYDVDSPNAAYNGFWMKLPELDLTQYKALDFQIKGDAIKDFTKRIKVELKTPNKAGSTYINGITNEWQKIKIPLSDFSGINDWKEITELVIVFEDKVSRPKIGIIYIDNIQFSNNAAVK